MVRLSSTPGGAAGGSVTGRVLLAASRCFVTGVVQGVGFRPFVHRLALKHELHGWVRNDAGEVVIVVEGAPDAITRFLAALEAEAPPLARIERVEAIDAAPEGLARFEVLASAAVDQTRRQPLPADVALCPQCLADLMDPANRRYRYPFITCTDCGPRFTVIDQLPYQRDRTSMGAFAQCDECLREFQSPEDRRFHSETNSCPACGPTLWLELGSKPVEPGRRESKAVDGGRRGSKRVTGNYEVVLRTSAGLLQSGEILAIRGLGGFHLAVDATNRQAVERLRARKRREAKPLAVMVRSVTEAAAVALVGPREEALLLAPERPIVLLPARPGAVAAAVHPGLDQIGVMLAYTPLHVLLLELTGRPLVMTSGNLSEEPIAAGLPEARDRLGSIADGFLMHDREIRTRCDDSVVRPVGEHIIMIRRARGYAPLPLRLPLESPVPLLAVGPHQKNTATLVHGNVAYITPHVGDLENLETLDQFQHLTRSYQRLFHVEPEVVAHDLHPGYLSTRIAQDSGLPVIGVQHHHAHIAAVAAEHGITGSVVGLAFDGTGYGDDGMVWGAEILLADLCGYERVAHLRYAPLPGGDLASRAPWRAALGYLSLEPERARSFERAFAEVPSLELALARTQIQRKLNAPRASSMGRLFDAAAAVLGVRATTGYEGQAAMELEALAARHDAGKLLPFPVRETESGFLLDPVPLLGALGEMRNRGAGISALAADFHASVAAAAVRVARWAAALGGVDTVALGGGTFQNVRLLTLIRDGLRQARLRVLTPERLSPNDGAISYGQAAVAAARLNQ
ncbi:MAG TPA: carbamoyltransferase HypF [Gemmatimonadales bacterium]